MQKLLLNIKDHFVLYKYALSNLLVKPPVFDGTTSQLTLQSNIDSPNYQNWCSQFSLNTNYHRKFWEHIFILDNLFKNNMLQKNKKGIGFGVGGEPLTAIFAKYGCQVVSTDLDPGDQRAQAWIKGQQHSSELMNLYKSNIIDLETFNKNCSFEYLDMNHIPEHHLKHEYDFTWSSCSLDHLGTLEASIAFICNSLKCIKPGGVAIHTTEYNLTSNKHTLTKGPVVFFRKKDIEYLVKKFTKEGYLIKFSPYSGFKKLDLHYDTPPYKINNHLKLKYGKYLITSIGLIIKRPN